MYVELTQADTIKDLQALLIDAIPHFEFPRFALYDYVVSTETKRRDETDDKDFIIGVIWHSLDDMVANGMEEEDEGIIVPDYGNPEDQYVVVEKSHFNCSLTSEEINILAILMMCAWVQRQVTSIESTRMKYSGPDFKMTSQANHLSKLLSLLSECQRQSLHMQRLYKRRRPIQDSSSPYNGLYRSNWDVFGAGVYYDRYRY